SVTVGLARGLSEKLGPLTAAAAVYAVSGTLALAALFLRGGHRTLFTGNSRRYLFGCGTLFVAYMLFFYLAIGGAVTREEVLAAGLLNYLWPVLTLIGTVVILGNRWRWPLVPGTLLALAGIYLVIAAGGGLSWDAFAAMLARSPVVYLCGAAAAVVWALYSVLARKWGGDDAGGAVALFLPVTAAVLLLLSLFADEPRRWNGTVVAELTALGLATFLGYQFWDDAMRRGTVVLVAAASYLTPLLATLFAALYLGVAPGLSLWLGCFLLIVGSLISWRSVGDRSPDAAREVLR
ncbi:MAG TPA: aromatic amino acid DMT transporter YddG, partial [bacterium]|nr:aromatic amino acid DMT transporter YddG [bacterium]